MKNKFLKNLLKNLLLLSIVLVSNVGFSQSYKVEKTTSVEPDTTYIHVENSYEDPENPDGLQISTEESLKVEPLFFTTSTKSAKILKSSSLLKSAMTDTPIWPEEGAVNIEKTAQSTADPEQWKINVKVEGKNIENSTDVVLVIDDSGSMGSSKMEDAKDAAKTFVDQLIPTSNSGNIRIAIVTINSSISGIPEIDKSFSKNVEKLKSTINTIN